MAVAGAVDVLERVGLHPCFNELLTQAAEMRVEGVRLSAAAQEETIQLAAGHDPSLGRQEGRQHGELGRAQGGDTTIEGNGVAGDVETQEAELVHLNIARLRLMLVP